MKLRVLLDMDGVIVNFYHGFAQFLNKNYSCTLDPDTDPESYSFKDWGSGADRVDFDIAIFDWISNGGFRKLIAYDGAQEFVQKLMKYCDVSIVTARIGDWDKKFPTKIKEIIKNDTIYWLEQHGIPTNKLFFAHEKVTFCKEYGISVMIEDKISTALDGSKNGIHTILMDRGYNGSQVDRFKIYRVYNFNEAIKQIGKLL